MLLKITVARCIENSENLISPDFRLGALFLSKHFWNYTSKDFLHSLFNNLIRFPGEECTKNIKKEPKFYQKEKIYILGTFRRVDWFQVVDLKLYNYPFFTDRQLSLRLHLVFVEMIKKVFCWKRSCWKL